MPNRSSEDQPEASAAAPTRDEPGNEGSRRPNPDLDRAVQGFSTSLEALKGLIRELAAQKEQEAAAARSSKALAEYYRGLFHDAPGGCLVTDTEAAIQESNQAAADLLQTQMVFLLGQRLDFFVNPDDQEIFTSMLELARHARGPKVRLVRVQPPGGSPRPVFLGIAGRRNPAGELIGFTWLMQAYTPNRQEDEVLHGQLAKLEALFTGLVEAFSVALEMRDPYAAGHQQRVAQLACGIADQMGFSPDRVAGLKIMGLLHDVGKVAIPAEILNKVGLLTVVEDNVVKTHPQLGYDLLKDLEFPWPVAQAILQHHEKWDGSGYPAGLSGEEIIIEARILGVANAVAVLVSPRPCREAASLEKALEEVYQEGGRLYDAGVVDAALKLFVEKGFKFI